MTGVTRTRRMLLRASSLLFLLLAFCSCDGTVMHSFGSSVGNAWLRSDTVVYVYDGSHSRSGELELSVEAITLASYRYKNLTIQAECRDSRDSLLSTDTFTIEVFDDEGWRKGATAGLLYQLKSVPRAVNFPHGDSIRISLSHLMPADTLVGVNDVGVRITN